MIAFVYPSDRSYSEHTWSPNMAEGRYTISTAGPDVQYHYHQEPNRKERRKLKALERRYGRRNNGKES